jgi:branched-chain amino acid transport system permease protein
LSAALTEEAAASRASGTARLVGGLVVPTFVFAGFALAPLVAPFGPEGYILSLLTRVMIFALAGVSLDLILGYGGLISFGHAAFLGIGAYSVAILTSHRITDAFAHLVAALAVSALFALLTGTISLRTKGVYFIMITLAFGQMLFFLATSLAAYGGDDGMTLPSRSLVFEADVLGSGRSFYYVVFGCLLAAYLLCRAIVASRFGRVLRGSRENPVRMEAIGFNPFAFQLAAYVIAGMLCGIAGFLLANHTEFVSPAYMTWQRSGDLIFMTVLGGLGSGIGAVVGAAGALVKGKREADEILAGAAIGAVVGGGIGAYMDRQQEKLARIPGTTVERVGEDTLLVHDEHHPEPSLAFALSRLTLHGTGTAPVGVFRDVEAPVYDVLLTQQLEQAREKQGQGDLEALLHAGDTWTIS